MSGTAKPLRRLIALCSLLILLLPVTVLANSAEPSSLVILVNNPPADLSIALVSGENYPEAAVRKAAWEGYYLFYSRDLRADSEYTFRVTASGESFDCTLDAPLQRYNNVFTLNLAEHRLTPGTYPFRSLLLVSIRLLLTLLLEGGLFWLFGFRQRHSWLAFLAVNLITQGGLNVWLNSGGSLLPNYLIIKLILGEFFVFAAELIALPAFIAEHKRSRVLLYAFTANLVSLIAGGYIISVLPV